MAVWVAGARGVVADDRGLESLSTGTWTWRSRGPALVVECSASQAMISTAARFLGGVVRSGDLRVQRCGERPGLRAVDDDLDQAQRVVGLADPPFALPVSTS